MDCDIDRLTALLLDPCLTTGEAEREAAATRRRPAGNRPRAVAPPPAPGYPPDMAAEPPHPDAGGPIGSMGPAVLPPR